MLEIRIAQDSDYEDVLRIEREAYGEDSEAELVRDLLVDPTEPDRITGIIDFVEDPRIDIGSLIDIEVRIQAEQIGIAGLAKSTARPGIKSSGLQRAEGCFQLDGKGETGVVHQPEGCLLILT